MTRTDSVEIERGWICNCVSFARSAVTISIALTTLLLIDGCGGDRDGVDAPRVLRVAVIPDRPRDEIERIFRPLLDFIAADTGFTFELVFPQTYEQTLDLVANDELDLVRFGGYSYVVAQQRYGAKALVTRDVDLRFRSVIIVHRDLAVNDLTSLRGRSLEFGPRYSTSGHVMPRIFLEGAGIVPEEFFSDVVYGVNHIDTLNAVVARDVDAGAMNAVILERALRRDESMANTIRIIWTSPRYANYVWATRADLDVPARHAIRGAFLALTVLDHDDKVILDGVGAAGYLPAQQKSYDMLTRYVRALELNSQ